MRGAGTGAPGRLIHLSVALALLGMASALGAETHARTVARVNGSPIHDRQVREIVKSVIASSSHVPSGDELDRLSEAALDSLIELELLFQEAEARKIAVNPAEIEAAVQQTRQQFSSPEEFAAALHQSGITEAGLRSETRKALLVGRLLETVVWRDVAVSPEEINDFYQRSGADGERGAAPHVRHILVGVGPGAPAAQREQALLRARALLNQVQAGGRFEQLAREHSDDSATAASGGDLGFLDSDLGSSPLVDAARRLEPGAMQVVETEQGYHVIQVVERRAASPQPPAEMRQRIVRVLEEDERERRRARFLADLRAKSTIELLDDDAGPENRGASLHDAPTGSGSE